MLARVDKEIERWLYAYAQLVYKQPLIPILVSVSVTVVCGCGLIKHNDLLQPDVEFVFSPSNGQYYREKLAISEHWPHDEDNFLPMKSFDYNTWNDLIIARKDGGNVMETDVLQQIDCLNRFIISNLSIPFQIDDEHIYSAWTLRMAVNNKQKYISYDPELCLRFDNKCFTNEHVQLLLEYKRARKAIEDLANTGLLDGSRIFGTFIRDKVCEPMIKRYQMSYPTAYSESTPLWLGEVLGRVKLQRSNETELIDSVEEKFCRHAFVEDLKSVDYIRLTYNLRQATNHLDEYSYKWRMALYHLIFQNTGIFGKLVRQNCGANIFQDLDMRLNQNYTLAMGLRNVSKDALPLFGASFLMLVVFAGACSLVVLRHQNVVIGIDWTRSKLWIALASLMVVVMALISAVGLLMWFGVVWNDVITTMPFLVLAIGIDDLFILLSAWHRTKVTDKPDIRLAHMLTEAGVSITITSVTDVLSFAIGCFTTLPAVWIFCSYTAVSLAFAYLYMLTILTPLMAYFAHFESSDRLSLLMAGSSSKDELQRNQKALAVKHRKISHRINTQTLSTEFFRNYYGNFITHPTVKCIILILMYLYWIGAIYGLTKIEQGLNPRALVNAGDPFEQHFDQLMSGVGQQGLTIQVVVNNAPNLADPVQRAHTMDLLNEYGQFEYSMGQQFGEQAVLFWLYTFLNQHQTSDSGMVSSQSEDQTIHFYSAVQKWMNVKQEKIWQLDVKWASLLEILKRYSAVPDGHGFNMSDVEKTILISHVSTTLPDRRNRVVQTRKVTNSGETEKKINEEVISSKSIKVPNTTSIYHIEPWQQLYSTYCHSNGSKIESYDFIPISSIRKFCMIVQGKMDAVASGFDVSQVQEINTAKVQLDRFVAEARAAVSNISVIDAFRFQVGLHHYNTTLAHGQTLRMVRAINERYSDLNVTAYNIYSAFSEQYLVVLPTTVRNVLIALPCMLLVALLMIPSLTCALLIALSILSIDAGVIGYMSLWSVNVDVVSMITILMSIGFAVDFTAHVSYAYVIATGTDKQRCVRALETLGWPILQGGVSTLLGVILLGTAEGYMMLTFFKTVFLVISCGLLHSLLFLPVILTTALPSVEKLCLKFRCENNDQP